MVQLQKIENKLHTGQSATHPLATGPAWHAWLMQEITRQFEALQKTRPEDAPLSRKAIGTPRDAYGWRS